MARGIIKGSGDTTTDLDLYTGVENVIFVPDKSKRTLLGTFSFPEAVLAAMDVTTNTITVDQAGWVTISGRLTANYTQKMSRGIIIHNSHQIYSTNSGEVTTTDGALCLAPYLDFFTPYIPINAGDTFQLAFWTVDAITYAWTDNAIKLYFYPSLIIRKELPTVIEKNGSYSLDEVQLAETWYDGRPIYRRCFSNNSGLGNLNGLVSNGTKILDMGTIIPGLAKIVKHGIIMNVNNLSDPNLIGTPSTNSGVLINYVESTFINNSLYIRNNSTGTLNTGHTVVINGWIEYIKN